MSDETAKQGAQEGQSTSPEESKLTQAQVDAIVEDRLKRDRESRGYSELKEKAEKFDKWQEENKSELELANERATEAEKKLQGYQQKEQLAAWAKEVTDEAEVGEEDKAEFMSLLRGSTKEDFEAHAKSLLPRFKKDATPHIKGDGYKGDEDAALTDEQVFAQFMDKNFK